MKNRKMVLQVLPSLVLVLSLIVLGWAAGAPVAGASVTMHPPADYSVSHVAVDSWSDAWAMALNTPQGQVVPMVAAGATHTVGLKIHGTVIAVGSNTYGQCDVSGWTDIVQVAAGATHTVGLKIHGTVIAVGSNTYGQCDVSGWTDIVQVAADQHTVGLKSDGTVVAVGFNPEGGCNVGGWTDIAQVAAGSHHTVGLKSDGTVVAVGSNTYGQCNVGGWTDIVQVAADRQTVGVKSDGTVVAVGWNDYGQCNVGSWTNIVQVAAGVRHTVGLKSDGTVVAVGSNDAGQCNVGGWTDIVQVSAGGIHTVGLKSDGTVVATGENNDGRCDVGGWNLTDSAATATGTGTAFFAPSQGFIEDLTAIPAYSLPSVTFPHGMFSFKITGLTPGQTVTLTVELPSPVPVGTVWWKYDNGRWHSLPNLDDNGNSTMKIRLTDGGTGDMDNIPGQITDPGGPGNPMTVGWEGSPVSGVAVLGPWIALLAVICAGASLLMLRRRRGQAHI